MRVLNDEQLQAVILAFLEKEGCDMADLVPGMVAAIKKSQELHEAVLKTVDADEAEQRRHDAALLAIDERRQDLRKTCSHLARKRWAHTGGVDKPAGGETCLICGHKT